jgi:GNAT superfamily N-acetyltransferase
MTVQFHYAIRPATVRDAPVIARHRVAMFTEMGHVPGDELASQLLAASTSALESRLQDCTYVGRLAVGPGEQVLAGAGVHVRPQLPRMSSTGKSITTGPVPLLVNVYTEPQWRGRGVARALVRALMRWTADQGFDHMVLHASDAGRPLYVSLGFAATNEMRWSPWLSSSVEQPC